MSEIQSQANLPPQITLTNFYMEIQQYSYMIENDQSLNTETCLKIGRLWNTALYYTQLQSVESVARFNELVRDKALLKIVELLNMEVSRGYSFYSPELNFRIGGILEEQFRYQIVDIEVQGN
jgi:hypothetical protein